MQTVSEERFIISRDENIEIHPIALLLPEMDADGFDKFKEDISGNGVIEPIILWQGKVLDGRHRYRASKELGIDIDARHWEGGMDPVEYVVSKNLLRRHLSKPQLAMCAAKAMAYHTELAKERQRESGGDKKSEEYQKSVSPKLEQPIEEKKPFASNKNENKANSKAGKLFGVSKSSVASAKVVLDHGTEEEKKAVESGDVPLVTAEKIVRERIKNTATKAYFNKTTDSIEWAKWTWNPVTGCKHGCQYCYARDIANRYSDAFPEGFEPTFHPERLGAPENTKIPLSIDHGNRNVFVCSMADLFGEWVPQEWIDQIIESCTKAPEWTFIFLTKNPKRLVGIEWPENAWVGTTVDCQVRVDDAVSVFYKLNQHKFRPVVTFLSCEPLNEELDFGERDLNNFDWVIIGGRSSSSCAPAFQPKWEWVESLHNSARASGCKIYWKPNLKVRPTEYPG
jgi:protein gp37